MFQYENEANAFYEALDARLKKFNLELAKDKSKIIRFGRFAKQHSADGKTDTFDIYGHAFKSVDREIADKLDHIFKVKEQRIGLA